MLSYSGIVGHGSGKVTAPVVTGLNKVIQRDPPRSITTRRADKVSADSHVLATLADSGDRFCEAINHYARGINPMVSVSYGEGQFARPPYVIAKDGAFRPPIRRMEELLPLSRQPRTWTSMQATPFEVDFSRRIFSGDMTSSREIKSDPLHFFDIEANRTYSAGGHVMPPSTVHAVKDEVLHCSADTAKSSGVYVESVARPNISLPMAPRPNAAAATNPSSFRDVPVAPRFITTERNVPVASGPSTNFSGPVYATTMHDIAYERLIPTRKNPTMSFGGCTSMARMGTDITIPKLKKVK